MSRILSNEMQPLCKDLWEEHSRQREQTSPGILNKIPHTCCIYVLGGYSETQMSLSGLGAIYWDLKARLMGRLANNQGRWKTQGKSLLCQL